MDSFIDALLSQKTDKIPDVYYKVYSIEDDKIITIYYGFRQFLLVDWK